MKAKNIITIAGLSAMTLALPLLASAKSQGKILVVLSSAQTLELKEGQKYKTGYFLNELAVPLKAIIDAGYTPVFTNPNGNTPAMDENSNNKNYFGGNEVKRTEALKLISSQKELVHPQPLSSIAKSGTKEFVGIFIPGGHAPMQDLLTNKDLGKILKSAHASNIPTGIICHGPIALLSTLDDPSGYRNALVNGKTEEATKLAKNWPYAGYKMTVFSTAEEKQVEGKVQLGGSVLFYPDAGLSTAGAQVQNAEPWKSNVVEDRELVTGQQPMSDQAFAEKFIAKLKAK